MNVHDYYLIYLFYLIFMKKVNQHFNKNAIHSGWALQNMHICITMCTQQQEYMQIYCKKRKKESFIVFLSQLFMIRATDRYKLSLFPNNNSAVFFFQKFRVLLAHIQSCSQTFLQAVCCPSLLSQYPGQVLEACGSPTTRTWGTCLTCPPPSCALSTQQFFILLFYCYRRI